MFVWLLVGCFLILMFARMVLPIGVPAEGRELAKVRLSYRERLLMQRTNIYALGVLLLLAALGQWFSTPVIVALILIAFAIVNLPAHYKFTSQGIAFNNVTFRKWKEFEYVRIHGARVTLMPRKGYAPLRLFLSADRQRDVLSNFQMFLQVRQEAPPPLAILAWIRRRLPVLLLASVLIFISLVALSACGEGTDGSGLTTANQSNLT